MTSYCVIIWRVICEIISVHLSPLRLDFEVFSVINLRETDETQKCFPARRPSEAGRYCGFPLWTKMVSGAMQFCL